MSKRPNVSNYFVCQRSGKKYPISMMRIEPGTGFKVHWSYSDGSYSLNRHPQTKPPPTMRDEGRLPFKRPDTHIDGMNYIVDDNYVIIVDHQFQGMIY